MATKKSKKKKNALKNPPAQLIADLQAALQKHKFSGAMIIKPALGGALAAGNPCPNGGTPQEISFQQADGTWVTKIVCV